MFALNHDQNQLKINVFGRVLSENESGYRASHGRLGLCKPGGEDDEQCWGTKALIECLQNISTSKIFIYFAK